MAEFLKVRYPSVWLNLTEIKTSNFPGLEKSRGTGKSKKIDVRILQKNSKLYGIFNIL